MDDLRIGAAILKEALDREMDKEDRARRSMEEQKAVAAAAAQNVRVPTSFCWASRYRWDADWL